MTKPIAGIGSYASTAQRIERKPAQLIAYQGSRAHIRFHDGMTYSMPADPLRRLGVKGNGLFFVVVRWSGKTPVETSVELPVAPRGPVARAATPAMYVRQGRRMKTRKPVP